MARSALLAKRIMRWMSGVRAMFVLQSVIEDCNTLLN
jgi:hypothetical protein